MAHPMYMYCIMLENLDLYPNSAVIVRWFYSRRVHRIEYMYIAVKKGDIVVNILLLNIFIANYCYTYKSSCVSA